MMTKMEVGHVYYTSVDLWIHFYDIVLIEGGMFTQSNPSLHVFPDCEGGMFTQSRFR